MSGGLRSRRCRLALLLPLAVLAGCATLSERPVRPLVAAATDTLLLHEGDLLTRVSPDAGWLSRVLRTATGGCALPAVGRPVDVDRDEAGRLLVCDGDLGQVIRLSVEGCAPNPYEVFQLPVFSTPTGVEAFPAGIAVADAGRGTVFLLDDSGDLIGELAAPGGWVRPGQMHWDGQHLHVVDAGRHLVHSFDGAGVWTRQLGGVGAGAGRFLHPVSVCTSPDGRLWVLDALNHRVQAFTPDGEPDTAFCVYDHAPGGFMFPKGLAFDGDGNLYVSDAGVNRVQVFSQGGALLYWFGSTGRGQEDFLLPGAICAHGNLLYIADPYNRRVQMYRYVPYLSAEGKP